MQDTSFKKRISEYLELANSRPELFSTPPNGVRILLEPEEIAATERSVSRDLQARALSTEGAIAGIVLRDPWFYVIRDAVEFADGSRRMYARIINRFDNGSAVLPMIENKIVLIRHFRHPLRRAILEIPRGGIEPGNSPETTARIELHEEVGGIVRRMEPLGFLYGSTNLYGNGAYLYFADLESIGEPRVEEGIESIEQVSVAEFETLLGRGEILDSFTVAAYTHAKLRRLI